MTAINGAAVADTEQRTSPLHLLGVGDDDLAFRELARYAEAEGAVFDRVRDSPAAIRALGQRRTNALLVVLDQEPEQQLSWWVEVLHRTTDRPRLVTLVSSPSIGFALYASQAGVFEVLPVPVGRERFVDLLRRLRAAEDETVLALPDVRPVAIGPYQMVSESPAMLAVFRTIAQVAPTTATVLVVGESGTGKELVARAIHQRGPRAAAPFVAVNCAAIPENLLESELFGHEKGSFTGAIARKIGRFERANGGTLFLDEIGDMSLALQSKILRAIQEREVERVGSSEAIPVDVRLIAATNRDVPALITSGRFREDLYYRLAVVTIKLPRLVERGDDLLLLTTAFLREFGQRYGKTFTGISDRALVWLRRHEWLGNVRELRNVVERAALVAESDVLRSEHLPEEWRVGSEPEREPATPTLASLQAVEAQHIARVLAHTHGQISQAARILGVHRNTLARKIREYGL
jgi:two-component system response regulator HydG